MSYPNVKAEALEASIDLAFEKYIWQAQNNTDAQNYHLPWQDFKEDIWEIVTSEHAVSNTYKQLILRLKLLTINNFNGIGIYNNSVRFDLGFSYEVLYEIASRSKSPSIMEDIVDFCAKIREKLNIFNTYTNCLRGEYLDIMETRVYKAVCSSGHLNPYAARKILRNTTINFFEYFVENHMQTFAICPHLYGYIFNVMYEKYSGTWPSMEAIYSFYDNLSYEKDSEIVSSVISASQNSSDIDGLIIGAMSRFAPRHALEKLSTHKENVVRFAAAFNTSLDIKFLANLAQDDASSVKWRAIKTLKEIQMNDKTEQWRRDEAKEALIMLGLTNFT